MVAVSRFVQSESVSRWLEQSTASEEWVVEWCGFGFRELGAYLLKQAAFQRWLEEKGR